MAYDEFTAKMVRKCSELEQALAEKDMEWKRRVGLDCGGHSCFYAIEKNGMRHNGRCSCDPKRTKQDYDVLYATYQQLMEKAVRFAETLVDLHEFCDIEASDIEASTFLGSPQVQAWKEQEIDCLSEQVYVLNKECRLMEKEHAIQQIREHEFQRGYQEAEEKYQQIYEGGCPHDSLGDQARTIEQQAQEIARLREALEHLVDTLGGDSACRLDHHGLCQEHFLNAPCEVHQAQQALKETTK